MRSRTQATRSYSAAIMLAAAILALAAFASPAALSQSTTMAHERVSDNGISHSGNAHFVPNHGQWADDDAAYLYRSLGMDVVFDKSSLRMHLRRPITDNGELTGDDVDLEPADYDRLVLTVTFPGSNPVQPIGVRPQAARFNYYLGDDESRWATDVPSFGAIVYPNLYDNIDLHVTGVQGGVLKYEFHAQPPATGTENEGYHKIRIRYDCIDSLTISERGDLLIDTEFGTLIDNAPIVWQDIGGRRVHVPARFEKIDEQTYTIALLTEVDPAHALVIDPELEWMYYYGGTGHDAPGGVVVDAQGNTIAVGETSSSDFAGSGNTYYGGPMDAFVMKVNPSGELLWMTFLGGSGAEVAYRVNTDSAGDALVVGWTNSTNFAGRINNYLGGGRDAFVLKINPSGMLLWMRYLGGSFQDTGHNVAADSEDNLLVTGWTYSLNFEGKNNSIQGITDAFLVKVNPSGGLEWMTYLGGGGLEVARGIVATADDSAIISGWTTSTNFPLASNSYYGGDRDGFLVEVSAAGLLQWMTYIGGNKTDDGRHLALDGQGHVYLTGWTDSLNFVGAQNTYHGGERDGFIVKVALPNPGQGSGAEVLWMKYLGGSGWDVASGIALDAAGDIFIAGPTGSSDFEGALNSHYGDLDAFLVKMTPSGELEWMMYLGGSDEDRIFNLSLDNDGNAILAGKTASTDFDGAKNSYHGGPFDGCILRVALPGAACPGDLTGDGNVGVADLLVLLASWGPCADPADCPADLDGDGAVGVPDLLILLSNWGECP